MQAVILAAGKGTRIFPMAVSKPKPLIQVANKPVLAHNLDQLLGIVNEVVIIVGYKKDLIINQIGDNYKGIKIKYVAQEDQLGTGHAVLQAKNYIHEKFLVLNGDDLFSRKDMENISKYDNSILIKYKKDASAFGAVVVENHIVKDIVEKSKEFVSNFVNTGMYCFSTEVFDILKGLEPSIRGEYELTDAVKILASQGKMNYEEVEGFWIPVGYPWHILDATQQLLEDKDHVSIKGKIAKGVLISGSVDIGEGTVVDEDTLLQGNIVIGKNCKISKGCVIKGFTAIGDNTIIYPEVTLHNAIIGQRCNIEEGCVVKDSVLGDEVDLSERVRIENWGKGKSVKLESNGKVFDSGKEKLGAFVGDKCKVHKELDSGECVHEDC
jgi:UDP-N-acetylglucosamine diphosphorylase / glucose-1-phosphate thymidylyltransferase / UDP-N-acetylgalactosamine diphosphorylase / glucosamine-1-phosphate N-acetyltransferase / galactosamine-1-phosphate N-acetyltransferase